MQARPRIKLTLTALDNKLELASKIFLVLIWALTSFTLFTLPTTIPVHFNAAGQPDGYGNKFTLLILPVLATIFYLGLTILNRYPHIFNYLTPITRDNAEKQYSIATRMLRFLKLAILLIFSTIILFTYFTTIGITRGIGTWFLPLASGLLLIPLIISISRSLRKR